MVILFSLPIHTQISSHTSHSFPQKLKHLNDVSIAECESAMLTFAEAQARLRALRPDALPDYNTTTGIKITEEVS